MLSELGFRLRKPKESKHLYYYDRNVPKQIPRFLAKGNRGSFDLDLLRERRRSGAQDDNEEGHANVVLLPCVMLHGLMMSP
jgi:hypothetical protein